MSRSTISTFELFQMFPDAGSAEAYFTARRWSDGAVCPACEESQRIGTRKGGFYLCGVDRMIADPNVYRARKAGPCDRCQSTIAAGDGYRAGKAKAFGWRTRFATERICLACAEKDQ